MKKLFLFSVFAIFLTSCTSSEVTTVTLDVETVTTHVRNAIITECQYLTEDDSLARIVSSFTGLAAVEVAVDGIATNVCNEFTKPPTPATKTATVMINNKPVIVTASPTTK